MASRPPVDEMFVVEPDGRGGLVLERRVVPRRGQPYIHRCGLVEYEQVALAAEELGEAGFTHESLVAHERAAGRDPTWTTVATALAFMRERGIIDYARRRNFALSDAVHLDAMTEFHALAAGA